MRAVGAFEIDCNNQNMLYSRFVLTNFYGKVEFGDYTTFFSVIKSDLNNLLGAFET